jgi:hypothetical protein
MGLLLVPAYLLDLHIQRRTVFLAVIGGRTRVFRFLCLDRLDRICLSGPARAGNLWKRTARNGALESAR